MPATPTYSPPTPQKSTEFLRPYPRRYARYAEIHPVPPLKGLGETRAASVSYRASVPAGHAGCGDALSYRALAPGGAGTWCRTCSGTSGVPQPTAYSSLLTVHSSFSSGWQTFSYGKLGELTENIRTFALPFDNQAYTFIMKYEYDSWNRIQKMIYPDSEVVSYGYNLGGMLKSISGEKLGYVYHYIDSIQYNELEMKEALYYGNGTKTFYKYDVLQRLINLQSYTATTATPSELMQNIDYTYDAVSNITDIINSAGILANGLGGKYNNQYKYDNLYRLIYSTGNWDGIHPVQYKTVLGYLSNGRIEKKYTDAQIYQQTVYSNSVSNVFYDNSYHYNATGQKNTLSYIDGGPYQEFEWDAKGNMTYHKHDGIPMKRYLCWDEQNRLLGVMDNSNLSFYLYDANDDRTYKYTGYYTWQNQSGQWHYFYQMNNATLYASPYFVATKQGYTKHYYAESERICSKIGGGGLTDIDSLIVTQDDFVNKYASLKHHIGQVAECLNAPDYDRNAILNELYHWKYLQEDQEDKRYFYHPDHLGSSSWITYSDGKAVQHLHYLPWGENFVDQRTSSFSSMFTFSAKEKDAETGYSYFGSRYFNSDLSIWLSVDPMAAKYPSLSPYVYCANNPVKLVDPNGEEIDVSVIYQKNDDGSYKYKSVVKAFDFFAKTTIGQNFLSKYAKKGQTIAGHTYESDGYYHQKGIDISFISNDDKLLASGASGTTESNIKDGRMKTKINLSNTCESTGGAGNVLEALCHELFIHAYQDAQDYLDDKKLNNSQLNLYCKKLIGSYSISSIQHRQDASFNNMMSNYAMPILRAYYNGSSIYRKKLPDSEIKQRINNGLGGATIK